MTENRGNLFEEITTKYSDLKKDFAENFQVPGRHEKRDAYGIVICNK